MKMTLEGLDTLLETVSTERISKNLAIGVAHYRDALLGELRSAVVNTYSISSSEFDKRVKGKSTSTVTKGKNTIKAGIEIGYKPKPLTQFPWEERTVSVKSQFLMQRGNGYNVKRKQTAKEVHVAVRRGKFKKIRGAYYQAAGTSKWAKLQSDRGQVKSFRSGIYRRLGETWIENPVTRAKSELLFGPSVSQVSEQLLTQNRKLMKRISNIDSDVGKFIEGFS